MSDAELVGVEARIQYGGYCEYCKCVLSRVGVIPESVVAVGLKLLDVSTELTEVRRGGLEAVSYAEYRAVGERLEKAREKMREVVLELRRCEDEGEVYREFSVRVLRQFEQVMSDWMGTAGRKLLKGSVIGRALSILGAKVGEIFSFVLGLESRAEEQARVHGEFIRWIEKR